MFIKSTRAKGHDYLKIVESYYKDGKSRHRTVVNLGRADVLANSGLENIIRGLRRHVKKDKDQKDNIKDISTMKEEDRVNYGYIAFQSIWNKYSLLELLKNLIGERKIEFNFIQTVFLMVIN